MGYRIQRKGFLHYGDSKIKCEKCTPRQLDTASASGYAETLQHPCVIGLRLVQGFATDVVNASNDSKFERLTRSIGEAERDASCCR